MPDRGGLFPARLDILGRTQNRAVAELYGESFQRAATRKAAHVMPDEADDGCKPIRAAGIRFGDSRQWLAEHLTTTARASAAEAANAYSQLHHHALLRQVLY